MHASDLRRVKALLAQGECIEAKGLLSRIWNGPLPRRAPALLDLARDSAWIANLYGWEGRAERWLASARRQLLSLALSEEESEVAGASLESIETSSRLERDVEPSRRFFERFLPLAERNPRCWSPPIVLHYLATLLLRLRFNEYDAALRRLPLRVPQFSLAEKLILLRQLAVRHLFAFRFQESVTVLRSHVRLGRALECEVDIVSRTIVFRGYLQAARSAARLGRSAEARPWMERAAAIANRARCATLQVELKSASAVALESGRRYEAALDLCAEVLEHRRSLPENSRRYLLELGDLGRILRLTVRVGRLRKLPALLRDLGSVLKKCPSRYYQSAYHCYMGIALRKRRSGNDLRRAQRHFQLAEGCLMDGAGSDLPLKLLLALHRAYLDHDLGDLPSALRNVLQAHDIARDIRDPLQEADSLYLFSALLLEDISSKHQLYERTLGRIGVIRSPDLLFKVVANLYLYTWELHDEGTDLADLHLKQIQRMRECLSEERFRELYDECVARPMLRRFHRHFMGG
jgi:tetratricopeptide (TPR) repeat protein